MFYFAENTDRGESLRGGSLVIRDLLQRLRHGRVFTVTDAEHERHAPSSGERRNEFFRQDRNRAAFERLLESDHERLAIFF